MTKIGRNEPCPCGSGKKYKQCCLNKDRQNDAKDFEAVDLGSDMKAMEKDLLGLTNPKLSEAQDLVYDGWELLRLSPSEAKRKFEIALKLDPEMADAYNGLAEIALSKGHFQAAEEYYRQALEHAKTNLGEVT